jgi:hypothetical protein
VKKKLKVSKLKKQKGNLAPTWAKLISYKDYEELSCLCYGGNETTGFSVGGAPCPVHMREAVKTARKREREVCAKIAQKCGYLALAELLRKDPDNEILK